MYIDDRKKLLIKVYPKQSIYKEENGLIDEVPLRIGRLKEDYYQHREVITTILGKDPFVPRVEIEVITVTDSKCYIIITILDHTANTTIKQYVIKGEPKHSSLDDMKTIYNKLETILNDDTKKVIDLIDCIKKEKNIHIDEYC